MEGVFTVCAVCRSPTKPALCMVSLLIFVFRLVVVFLFVVVRVHPDELSVFGDLDFDFLAIGFWTSAL